MFVLALVSHMASFWFLEWVEKPHMVSLYGDKVRDEAGAIKSVKSKVEHLKMIREAQKLKVAAETSIKKAVDPLVKENLVDPLENVIKPRISQFVQETKHAIIDSVMELGSRSAGKSIARDVCKYSVRVEKQSYELGESIKVFWTSDSGHSSKKDDRIYLCPVSDNFFLQPRNYWLSVPVSEGSGTLTFSNLKLPWKMGSYEALYMTHETPLKALGKSPFEITVSQLHRIFSPIDLKEEGIALNLETFAHSLAQFLGGVWTNLLPAHLSSGSIASSSSLTTLDPGHPLFLFSEMNLSVEERETITSRLVYCIEAKYGVEFDPSVLALYPSVLTLARKVVFECMKM